MNKINEGRRIIIAVTERSPLPALWRVAQEHLAGPHDELITFLVHDERWSRAASLPFTREISRISGRRQDFTQWRAAQLNDETAARLLCQLQRLAKGAQRRIVLEVLPEREIGDALDRLGVAADVLIVPSELKRRPVYAELVQLRCEILIVDSEE